MTYLLGIDIEIYKAVIRNYRHD